MKLLYNTVQITGDLEYFASEQSTTLTTSGRAGSYSYAWCGTAAGSASDSTFVVTSGGTVVVIVTDAKGCTDQAQVFVDEPPIPLCPGWVVLLPLVAMN